MINIRYILNEHEYKVINSYIRQIAIYDNSYELTELYTIAIYKFNKYLNDIC